MPPDGADGLRRIGMVAIPTWPEPDLRLVEDDRAPAPILEDDALPAGWGGWLADEAMARGCPRDYVAAGLIATASALVGNARHVAPTATWTEPPHLWMALIGSPSRGKSPALRPIVETVRTIEREVAKKGIAPPDRPPDADALPVPSMPRLMAMDATTEELQHLLAGQTRGLLYVRDELAGWLGNHDRYGGHGADRAFYIEAWNGGADVADRVKHRNMPVRIERASLAILGGMQPDRLREVLAGSDDGLMARIICVWPEPAPIGPLLAEDGQAVVRGHRLLSAARRLYGLAMDDDPAGEPAPRNLGLDPAGLALFDEFRREAMERARSSRGLAAGWHGKNPGRGLRLALVYELLAWVDADGAEPRTVTADAMARAAGYLDYAAAMLERVTAGLAIGRAEADAAAIARHILATGTDSLNERVLYQRPAWAWLRGRERRIEALRVLADAGWIRAAAPGGPGRPRGDWEVSPRLWKLDR